VITSGYAPYIIVGGGIAIAAIVGMIGARRPAIEPSALRFMLVSVAGSFQRALVLSQKIAAVTDWEPSPVAFRYRLSATLAFASTSPRSELFAIVALERRLADADYRADLLLRHAVGGKRLDLLAGRLGRLVGRASALRLRHGAQAALRARWAATSAKARPSSTAVWPVKASQRRTASTTISRPR